MLLAVAGQGAGSMAGAGGLIIPGSSDYTRIKIHQVPFGRAMRIMAGATGGIADMPDMVMPDIIHKIVTLEAESGIGRIGGGIGKT